VSTVELRKLSGEYTIAKLPVLASIPSWGDGEGFVSISRGDDELSVICLRDRVPATVKSEGNWRCFKVEGPFVFEEAGIVLSVVKPLPVHGVGMLAVSTFNGNYLLVRSHDEAAAIDFFIAAGHRVA